MVSGGLRTGNYLGNYSRSPIRLQSNILLRDFWRNSDILFLSTSRKAQHEPQTAPCSQGRQYLHWRERSHPLYVQQCRAERRESSGEQVVGIWPWRRRLRGRQCLICVLAFGFYFSFTAIPPAIATQRLRDSSVDPLTLRDEQGTERRVNRALPKKPF